jgi:hypothetical protein
MANETPVLEDVITCVERIASSESARKQRHILLANGEQLEHFAQQPVIGDYDVRVVRGNDAIKNEFFPDGVLVKPSEDARTLYVIISDESPELPRLMGKMKEWARFNTNPLFYRGIVMLQNDHYNRGEYAHSENLRGRELDLTKKVSAYTRDELFRG